MRAEPDRLPREVFQRRLERILSHVDATSVFRASWTDVVIYDDWHSVFRVMSVGQVPIYVRFACDRAAPIFKQPSAFS